MGCVLGREASSGVVHDGKRVRRRSENYEKRHRSLSVESNDSLEVAAAMNQMVMSLRWQRFMKSQKVRREGQN